LKQDPSGTGIAEIVYDDRKSCLSAIGKYNNKMADGYVLKVAELKMGLSIAGAAAAAKTPLSAGAAPPVM
jgi:hypothetical protein